MESVACVKLVPRDRLCRDLYPSSQLSFDLVVFSWGNTLVSSFFLFYLHFFFFDWSLWKSHSHFSAILLDIIIVLISSFMESWHLSLLGTFSAVFPPFFDYCTMSLSLARTIHEVRRLPSRVSLLLNLLTFLPVFAEILLPLTSTVNWVGNLYFNWILIISMIFYYDSSQSSSCLSMLKILGNVSRMSVLRSNWNPSHHSVLLFSDSRFSVFFQVQD